jgi:signal recognition particle subunit SRP54
MFESLTEKFEGLFRRLRGQKTLSDDNMKEALREVRMALLEADVNYVVVKEFVARIREEAIGQDVIKGVNPAQMLISIVHKELVAMMTGGADPKDSPSFELKSGHRNLILMLGLQGAGKTTFCGKLALYLRDKKGRKPLLVACDVYRPAAVEQLKQVGANLKIPVFEMGTDVAPVAIVSKAKQKADELGCDVLIVDTAGRLHIDEVRMEELEAIRDAHQPDYTFLVADAMTGQDAVNSARAFHERVGIDGVCLTKLDGDARGGAALSIRAVTGRPVVFAGVGEKSTDLEPFYPERVAQRILGMGDVVSLVEKAQAAIDEKEAEELTNKIGKGEFNYNDFIKQMKAIKRMGSLKGLLGMLPGVGSLMKEMDNDVLTRELKRVEAMILSMTEEERANPEMVKKEGRRRDRIAKGSGHTLKQVNELVKQFEQMRGMMQAMTGGGMMERARAAMGAGGAGAMPDPSAILGGGGMPGMGRPGSGAPMPALPPGALPKRLQKQYAAMEKQQRAASNSNYTAPRKKRKKRK